MIKKRRLFILITSFFFVIIIMYITIKYKLHPIGFGFFIWWLGYIWHAFTYKKILINNDSLTFDAILRQKTFSFEIFKNADIHLMRGAVISITGYKFSVYVNPKSKDGLMKIIMLSDKIKAKDYYINKIEKCMQVF